MILIQEQDFDPGVEIIKLTEGNTHIGGVCSFIGLVRDFSDDQTLTSMTLEHYPGMTEKQLQNIEDEAFSRWSLDGLTIIHRVGKLQSGDRIVFVAAASAHRCDAFEACNFVMDWLKTKAPFWKKETGSDGDTWVDAKDSDEASSKRWDKT